MAFRIPGETSRFRQRLERAQQAREEQEKHRHDAIARQIELREQQEEVRLWKEHATFGMYLMSGMILDMLEDQRDANMPKTPDEPWNDLFCEAIRLIPEARMFVEEMSIAIIDENAAMNSTWKRKKEGEKE
jgi:hypothetical protein